MTKMFVMNLFCIQVKDAVEVETQWGSKIPVRMGHVGTRQDPSTSHSGESFPKSH